MSLLEAQFKTPEATTLLSWLSYDAILLMNDVVVNCQINDAVRDTSLDDETHYHNRVDMKTFVFNYNSRVHVKML